MFPTLTGALGEAANTLYQCEKVIAFGTGNCVPQDPPQQADVSPQAGVVGLGYLLAHKLPILANRSHTSEE